MAASSCPASLLRSGCPSLYFLRQLTVKSRLHHSCAQASKRLLESDLTAVLKLPYQFDSKLTDLTALDPGANAIKYTSRRLRHSIPSFTASMLRKKEQTTFYSLFVCNTAGTVIDVVATDF
jgi:hypothetical protein